MWSTFYTSKPGIVPDQYQRLVCNIKKDDKNQWPFEHMKLLRINGCYHFSFILNGNENTHELEMLNIELNNLENIELDGNTDMYITIKLIMYESKQWFENMMKYMVPNVCMCQVQNTRQASINYIGQFLNDGIEILKNYPNLVRNANHGKYDRGTCHWGVWGDLSNVMDTQLLLEKYMDKLKVVHLGTVDVPHFNLRTRDFSHSLGMNTYMKLEPYSTTTEGCKAIAAYAGEYDQSPIRFLCKTIFQLGSLVELSSSFTMQILKEELLTLLHPFVHRRKFFSANKVYKFVISVQHMEAIMEASERAEAHLDQDWHHVATTKVANRKLSYNLTTKPLASDPNPNPNHTSVVEDIKN